MRVYCFGDSNTYGYDPRSYFGGRYGEQDRWPELLAAKTGLEVVNAGLCGRRIPQRTYEIERIRGLLAEQKPDLLLVMLGTNDLLQGASAEEACSRMETFLTQIRPCCRQILLIAPPALKRGEWVPEDTLVTESLRMADAFRALAGRIGVPFEDAARWDVGLTFDGVHFTQQGNHTFAEALMAVIAENP